MSHMISMLCFEFQLEYHWISFQPKIKIEKKKKYFAWRLDFLYILTYILINNKHFLH